jgi:hypothetical protein
MPLTKKTDEMMLGSVNKLDKLIYAAENTSIRGRTALPPSAQWGLALAAMYTRAHGCGDRALEPWSNVKQAFSAEMLKEWWGIDGDTPAKRRNQAIGVLGWLATEGHRTDSRYVEPGDREAPKDLLAWDIARLVMVARHTFMSGYITEEEGWAYVRDAAKMAQTGFSSWEDYAHRYNRGRLRWSNDPEKLFDDAVDFLLKNAKSPWRTLDWHTPLKDEDFCNPIKIATKTALAREKRARRYLLLIVLPVVIAGVVIKSTDSHIDIGDFWSSSSRPSQTEPAAARPNPFPSLNASPLERFSQIDMTFSASRGEILASLHNTPILTRDRFAEFRYGINTATPGKSPDRNLPPPGGVPSLLELPSDTRFVTIQVQFQDGTMSPIRRFDVPASVRQPR